MGYERIAYAKHAYKRMKERRFTHCEVKRLMNEPEITHPSGEPDRILVRGRADDGRRMGVVYTEEHDRDADVLVVTVLDCESDE
jgi:Domain of unknown function (DUF4258)